MKRILLSGRTGCGKTSLVQRLKGEAIEYRKTQMAGYYDIAIDTPGEFVENRGLYRALIVSSYDCDVIGFVISVDEERSIFPPDFASAFNKPVVGIISKADLVTDESRVELLNNAENMLKDAGAVKIFIISSYRNEGIQELNNYLQS